MAIGVKATKVRKGGIILKSLESISHQLEWSIEITEGINLLAPLRPIQ
jgi:hypothetical protein